MGLSFFSQILKEGKKKKKKEGATPSEKRKKFSNSRPRKDHYTNAATGGLLQSYVSSFSIGGLLVYGSSSGHYIQLVFFVCTFLLTSPASVVLGSEVSQYRFPPIF